MEHEVLFVGNQKQFKVLGRTTKAVEVDGEKIIAVGSNPNMVTMYFLEEVT
jgi:hypothetical protein